MNPPVEAPASSTRRPATSTPKRSRAASSLTPARLTKRGPAPARRSARRDATRRAGFAAGAPPTSTRPGGDVGLAPGSATGASRRRTSSASSRRRGATVTRSQWSARRRSGAACRAPVVGRRLLGRRHLLRLPSSWPGAFLAAVFLAGAFLAAAPSSWPAPSWPPPSWPRPSFSARPPPAGRLVDGARAPLAFSSAMRRSSRATSLAKRRDLRCGARTRPPRSAARWRRGRGRTAPGPSWAWLACDSASRFSCSEARLSWPVSCSRASWAAAAPHRRRRVSGTGSRCRPCPATLRDVRAR